MMETEAHVIGARLGLLPWDVDRLTIAEVRALWDGWIWRQRLQVDMLATAAFWVRSAWVSEPEYAVIRESFGWTKPQEEE